MKKIINLLAASVMLINSLPFTASAVSSRKSSAPSSTLYPAVAYSTTNTALITTTTAKPANTTTSAKITTTTAKPANTTTSAPNTTTTSTSKASTTTKAAYNITFYGFDEKTVIGQLKVSPDEPIDYSKIDTSSLHTHINTYTERDFENWDNTPKYASSDMKIYALSKTATLLWNKLPKKTVYYSANTEISLNGFDGAVKIETQLPQKDSSGSRLVKTETHSILLSCFTVPKTAGEAFANGNTSSVIDIYSLGQPDKAICSFKIENRIGTADIDNNSIIDARDAAMLLHESVMQSSFTNYIIPENIKKWGDIDKNGIIDTKDAALILRYSSLASSYQDYSLDKFIDENEILK